MKKYTDDITSIVFKYIQYWLIGDNYQTIKSKNTSINISQPGMPPGPLFLRFWTRLPSQVLTNNHEKDSWMSAIKVFTTGWSG